MQSRQLVPAYFGVGHALNAFIESTPDGLALLQTMARDFPLFLDIIRNVEMALAKADFGIARLYASLVEDEALRNRVFTTLEAEFNLTRRMILADHRPAAPPRDQPRPRALHPPPQPLRRPHVPHPGRTHPPQTSHHSRQPHRRHPSSELNRAISATINGISAGLRNTG